MESLLRKLSGVIASGEGYKALCPCHQDLLPSLHVSEGEGGRILLRCHAGCETEDVLKALGLGWQDLGGDGSPASPRPKKTTIAYDAAVVRDRVYRSFLALLRLEDDDKAALVARGLKPEQIERYGYKSLRFPECVRAANQLYTLYGDELLEIPGFLRNNSKDYPGVTLLVKEGLLIPVRDPHGLIVAFQVRTGEPGRKYVWFSAPESPSGSPTHCPVHEGKYGVIRVTEGPLKADVAQALDGVFTLGVPGVSAWHGAVPLIESMREGLEEVQLAFDADQVEKPQVREQVYKFRLELVKAGLKVTVLNWDPAHKGIDDLLLAGGLPVTQPEVKRPTGEELYADGVGLGIRRAADMKEEELDWIWKFWLARGLTAILDGDPGLGKSTLTCLLAATITKGRAFPGDIARTPANVLIMSAEDSYESVLLPRLKRAGADLSRVYFVDGIRTEEEGVEYYALAQIPDDLIKLKQAIRRYEPALVVIDPLFSFVSAKYDSHKDASVRNLLSKLDSMLRDEGAAILGVRHLNKNDGQASLYRGGGSIAFVGHARSSFLMAGDADDPEVRYLAMNKTNIGPMQKTQKLKLMSSGDHPVLVWDGESDIPRETLLRKPAQKKDSREDGARVQWLNHVLREGPKLASEVFTEGAQLAGWSEDQLKKAKKAAGVVTRKVGKHWYWALPVRPELFSEVSHAESVTPEGGPEGA